MFRGLIGTLVVTGLLQAGQVMAELIDGEELVDPTRPFYTELSGEPDVFVEEPSGDRVLGSFDVSFVRIGSSSAMAIINSQRVAIGDEIGGATVVAIDRGGVTLMVDEQEQRVNLYPNNIKAPAATQ